MRFNVIGLEGAGPLRAQSFGPSAGDLQDAVCVSVEIHTLCFFWQLFFQLKLFDVNSCCLLLPVFIRRGPDCPRIATASAAADSTNGESRLLISLPSLWGVPRPVYLYILYTKGLENLKGVV